MGYYMRYLFEGEAAVDLRSLEASIGEAGYTFDRWENDDSSVEIHYQGEVLAELELEHLESGGEDEEIQELIEDVESIKGLFKGKSKKRVLAFLRQVQVRLVVRVLWGGRDGDETLDRLDPIWRWLMSNYSGLLQADDQGYFDRNRKLILESG